MPKAIVYTPRPNPDVRVYQSDNFATPPNVMRVEVTLILDGSDGDVRSFKHDVELKSLLNASDIDSIVAAAVAAYEAS